MIKIVGDASTIAAEEAWIRPDSIDTVAVSSEDPEFPIEDALDGRGRGWHASTPGTQRLSLKFHAPVTIRRIRLVIEEPVRPRTQEFVLEWRGGQGTPKHTVARQQFVFAPPGTSVEREDYATELHGVEQLELTLVPDVADASAFATLKEWRIGGEEGITTAATPRDSMAAASTDGPTASAAAFDDVEGRSKA